MAQINKIKGLIDHNKEIKKLTLESTTQALIILMDRMAYDEISVSGICRKAGISRNAFYKNFGTKDNVFKKIIIDFTKDILRELGNPFNKKVTLSWYVDCFSVIETNHELFDLIIKSKFQNNFLEIVNFTLTGNQDLDSKIRYERLMWYGALQNVVATWLKRGRRESVETMAKFCYEKLSTFKAQ